MECKYGTNDPIYKTKTDHGHGEQTCGCQGEREGIGKDREFGIGRCKLLTFRMDKQWCPIVQHRELYSISWIRHNGRQHEKKVLEHDGR